MPTIIEGLRKVKMLTRRIEKNRKRIAQRCSIVANPAEMNDEILDFKAKELATLQQSTHDLINERSRVLAALQVANVSNTVEYDGRKYTLSELMLLRRETIPNQLEALKCLRRQEKRAYANNNDECVFVFYDHEERDRQIDMLEDKLMHIDTALDEANATVEY